MNTNQKGFANIVLVVVVVLLVVGGLGYFVFVKQSEPITQQSPSPATNTSTTNTTSQTPAPPPASVVKDETASWNSYTYLSVKSGILPSITFKYPFLFGDKPTLISSRNTNSPSKISEDWGGFVEFNPTGAFGDRGLRIEFFKRVNSENGFENYVLKSVTSGGWGSPKYFQAGNYKVARIRFSSSSHYDADVGWYFVELSDKSILAISTSGDKKFIYDDDQNGNSTRDKIISTLTFASPTTTCKDGTESTPVITSLSRTSGPIGTELEIRGCNLSGFEGDLDVYFERTDGKKIMLTDTFGSYPKTGGSLIKVVVKEPCQQGETVYGRYSGIPAQCNYIALTPGLYKVYTDPWGKTSNTVSFTIQ